MIPQRPDTFSLERYVCPQESLLAPVLSPTACIEAGARFVHKPAAPATTRACRTRGGSVTSSEHCGGLLIRVFAACEVPDGLHHGWPSSSPPGACRRSAAEPIRGYQAHAFLIGDVVFEVAVAVPAEFVAVTRTRSREPRSDWTTTYVFAVAPEISRRSRDRRRRAAEPLVGEQDRLRSGPGAVGRAHRHPDSILTRRARQRGVHGRGGGGRVSRRVRRRGRRCDDVVVWAPPSDQEENW